MLDSSLHEYPDRGPEAGSLKSALEDSHRFRKILDMLPAAIYTTDAHGRITYFNEAAAALWGLKPELGKSEWCGSWKLFWPDGTALPHGECPMALAIREERSNRGMEAIAERPDGSRVPFIPYPTPLFDADGKLIGAVNMLVDITDRKRGEDAMQRLAAIVESSDDAIITKDLTGVIRTWNKGAEHLFGYKADEIIGKSVLTLIPEELHDQEPRILASISSGKRIEHFETVRRRKDGTLVDISLTVSPVKDQAGRITGASKVARDITVLKQTRDQRELLFREMEHRIKNLFALAAGVLSLSARTATTPKELAQVVGERLNALSRAQSLTLSTASPDKVGQSAMLHDLITTIAAPYNGQTDNGKPRVSIKGSDILIPAETMTALALPLHEFMTNAAKYGSLSVPDGYVVITTSQTDTKFMLAWKECNGPLLDHKADKEGFGSVLTRMTVERQLGGEITRAWQPDGLCIHLSIDRNRLTRGADA